MLQKKSKCRAVILTSLCSFLYVPLMIGVLSNSKPSAVSATAGETVIWTGNETYCQIANSDLPEENPEYLHIEFVNYENGAIYDYDAMNAIAYFSESDHGIISLSDSQWSDIRASGGFWIFSETEPFTQISYKVKEAATTIEKPEADETEFTYTGEGQTYEIADNDAYTVSNNVQTHAGEYEVTVSLNDPTTTTWDDGTTDDLTYDFVIAKAQVAKPSADFSTFTYNGEDQTYEIIDSELYEVSNNVQKNAGTYEVKVSLVDKDNYEWVDETTDDVTFEFVINKAQVVKPSEDSTTYTYNGGEQTYNVSSSDHYTVSGNKATEAGNHPVTVSLNDKDNFEWSDGSVEDLSFNFNINKAQVAKPNADTTSFTYNGEDQTYNISSSDAYTVSGNVQKNAGTYTVTVSLNDKNNTCWSDGSSEDLTFAFVIAKVKVAKPAADTTSFTYTGEDQTYNIASSDLYTVSGNVAKETGTHQVTVSLKDINNYEWEDSTTANLKYDFVIADKTCINHWFLIGILALGLLLVALSLFVFKDNLVGAISSGVFLVGSIVSTIFCGCTICIVFAVVDLALFVGSTGMFTFKFISKKKQKDSKKEDQDQTEDEKENN